MNKGISFYFGYDYNPEKRAEDIKTAGFDTIMTSADPFFDDQNATIRKQIKIYKKNGLKISSLHMRYKSVDLPHFFMQDKIGDKLEKDLKKDLKVAKKYGFICVVVHLIGELSEKDLSAF